MEPADLIPWNDKSDGRITHHRVRLGPYDVHLYRGGDAEPWRVDVNDTRGTIAPRITRELDRALAVDAARSHALLLVLPGLRAFAEQATALERAVAFAVADARLEGVV